MACSEKSTVGAQVMASNNLRKPSYPSVVLEKPSMESLDSSYVMATANQKPTSASEYDPTSTNPCSPFYSHRTTRTSFEQQKLESKTNFRIYEHDVESGSQVVVPTNQESKVWSEQVSKKDLCCQKRSRNPMRNMAKKQKLWTKVVIALFIVGAAVGLGIGISKATGSGVWKNANAQTAIGDDRG